jgi:hypothetical protein
MRRGEGCRIAVRKVEYSGWGVFDEYNFVPNVSGYSRREFTGRDWKTALEYANALARNDVNLMYYIRLKEASMCRGFR